MGEELEGDGAGELEVLGFVDYTHAAFAELLKDLVVGDSLIYHGASGRLLGERRSAGEKHSEFAAPRGATKGIALPIMGTFTGVQDSYRTGNQQYRGNLRQGNARVNDGGGGDT
jgi:hypothetical protein